jgi:hypothetical protein
LPLHRLIKAASPLPLNVLGKRVHSVKCKQSISLELAKAEVGSRTVNPFRFLEFLSVAPLQSNNSAHFVLQTPLLCHCTQGNSPFSLTKLSPGHDNLKLNPELIW